VADGKNIARCPDLAFLWSVDGQRICAKKKEKGQEDIADMVLTTSVKWQPSMSPP